MNLEKTVYLFIEVIENKVINIITLCSSMATPPDIAKAGGRISRPPE